MLFADTTAEPEAHEIPTDGLGLAAELHAHDRYMARLTTAVGRFVRWGDWDMQGYASAVQWLKDQARMTGDDAYRLVQQAKKLQALPVTAQAWLDGRLSGGQVRIIVAQVIDRHVELFAQHEPEVVPALEGLSVDDTLAALRLWRARADALNDGPRPADGPTARLSPTLDDRGLLTANLDADTYAIVKEALRIADSNDLDVTPGVRRGEALGSVAKFFLDHHDTKLRGRNRPHVNIVVNAETIGTDALEGYYAATGMRATPETLERVLCDCDLHRMLHTDGEVLDYGRASRRVPAAIYQAILVRDGGCRFPGCDRPPEQCDSHHVKPFSVGGTTNVWDAVLGCDRHHHLLHQPGWHAVLARDGTFTVTSPTGKTMSSQPRMKTQQMTLGDAGAPARPSRFERHLAKHFDTIRAGADLIVHFDYAA